MTSAPNIDKHVGARVKGRRMLCGLSLQQMADKIKVTEAQMFRYESGGTPIKPALMQKLAEILNVDITYFLEEL